MGQARDVVEGFYGLFPTGNIGEMVRYFDPSCITVMPTGSLTQEEHEAMGYAFTSAFPGAQMVVDRAIETADEIVVLGHFRGTQTGDLQSPGGTIPASRRDLNLRFMDYFRVADGKIVAHETVFDQMELLAQLGALATA